MRILWFYRCLWEDDKNNPLQGVDQKQKARDRNPQFQIPGPEKNKTILEGILSSWQKQRPLFVQLKGPGNIEPKMNIAIEKISGGFRDETLFVHCTGIGEVQLKDVTSGLNIETDGNGILN